MSKPGMYLNERIFYGRSQTTRAPLYIDHNKSVSNQVSSNVDKGVLSYQYYTIDESGNNTLIGPRIYNGKKVTIEEVEKELSALRALISPLREGIERDLASGEPLIKNSIPERRSNLIEITNKISLLDKSRNHLIENGESDICRTPWDDYVIMEEGSISIEEYKDSMIRELISIVEDKEGSMNQIVSAISGLEDLLKKSGLDYAGFATIKNLLGKVSSSDERISTIAQEISKNEQQKEKGSK